MQPFPPRQPNAAPPAFPPSAPRPLPTRPVAPYVALGIVVLVFAVLLAVVLSEPLMRWRYVVAGGLLGGLALFGAAFAGVKLYGEMVKVQGRKSEHKNKEFLAVNKNPVHRDAVRALGADWAAGVYHLPYQADVIKAQMTPQYPHLSHLSNTATNTAPPMAGPLALPNDTAPARIPDSEWLPWLDAMPHLLVAGRTGDGKTTLGNALLGRCINAGDEIAIIDPKFQPGKWRGCTPLAGSLDYDELYNALEIIGAELDARYQEFNAGRPGETFPRLRVVIDEVPTIILGAIVGGKIIDKKRFQQWLTFATKLGSIAREVNVNVWLFSQSPLIRDLYFSTSMRDNFNRIALASQVRDLLSEEGNKATKEALINLTRGKQHVAAMEYRGGFYVLDTDNVPRIAQEPVNAPQIWTPPAQPRVAPTERAVGAPPRVVPSTAQLAITNQDAIIDALRANGRMTNRRIASYTGIDLHTVQTETGEMYKQQRIMRHQLRSGAEKYEYSVPIQSAA